MTPPPPPSHRHSSSNTYARFFSRCVYIRLCVLLYYHDVGRKRCSSQQEEEGSGERRVGKAPPLKCKFSAEDVEDIACEYIKITVIRNHRQ